MADAFCRNIQSKENEFKHASNNNASVLARNLGSRSQGAELLKTDPGGIKLKMQVLSFVELATARNANRKYREASIQPGLSAIEDRATIN